VKLEIRIGKKSRVVELERNRERWHITLDGQSLAHDVSEVAPGVFSILLDGRSYEVRVAPSANGQLTLQAENQEFIAEVFDPRSWRGARHRAIEAEGRQLVAAPMPGKVIRMLVRAGDKVEMAQGLLVVEAMKMQNEIRSPKSGTVEKLLVKEGQPVNAGEILVWID
jgi:biotin carboxyl carrier protein